jgi:hypothetical protein
MINDLTALTNYCRGLQAQLLPLNSFTSGGPEKIFAGTRSGLKYPILWMEIPEYNFGDNHAQETTISPDMGLVVLVQKGRDPDAARALALTYALELVKKLHHDNRTQRFGFDLRKARLQPVDTLGVDDELGYRIGFPLESFFDLRLDETLWNL